MIGAPVAAARVTSLSVIAPTPECSTRTLISSVEMRLTALTIASTEPCTSALTTSGNSIVVDDAVGEHILEADRRRGGALLVEQALAIGGDFAGAGLVLDHGQRIAGRRHRGQAEHFDREGRAGFLHLAAIVVDHRADLARRRRRRRTRRRPCSVPRWTSTVASGPRPLSSLASTTVAFGGAVGIGLQLEHFGLELRSPRAACRGWSS